MRCKARAVCSHPAPSGVPAHISTSCSLNSPDRGKRPASPRCVRHGVARADGRSSPASAGRTPSRPPRSAAAGAAYCYPARSGRGPHARSDRLTHRGHRRAVPDPPHGQGPRPLQYQGAGQGVPRPGQRTAEVARGRGVRRVYVRLAGGQTSSPRPGSASGTPTPSSASGRPCAGSPDGAPTPRPTTRSPVLSPTDPLSGPPADRRAPSSSSPAAPRADHPPAEPPGQHAQVSISPKVVNARAPNDRSSTIPAPECSLRAFSPCFMSDHQRQTIHV